MMNPESAAEFNRRAWDAMASSPRQWFQPVSAETLVAARHGQWQIQVTATRPVPRHWLGDVAGKRILCLAAGGGHQGPVLAAAGAIVTVLDFSEQQLAIDAGLSREFGLPLKTVAADMRCPDGLADGSFDLVINPCSLNFCPQVQPVWDHAGRVLVTGGVLIAGFLNPVNYLFDAARLERGQFAVARQIPCRTAHDDAGESCESGGPNDIPLEFGHTLEELIGGQLRSGLVITDFMEDRWGGRDSLSQRIAVFAATRAVKQG